MFGPGAGFPLRHLNRCSDPPPFRRLDAICKNWESGPVKNLHDQPRMGRTRCQRDGGRPVAWLVRGRLPLSLIVHSGRGSTRRCFWNLDHFEFYRYPLQMTEDVISPFVMRQFRVLRSVRCVWRYGCQSAGFWVGTWGQVNFEPPGPSDLIAIDVLETTCYGSRINSLGASQPASVE